MPSRSCLASFAALAVTAHAQDAEVPIRTEAVGPGVCVLYGSGGNIGVCVGADDVFPVDDQDAAMTPKVIEAPARLASEPPRFVLNTRWHGDHTGGNENLSLIHIYEPTRH